MIMKKSVKQKLRSGVPVTMCFLCSRDANLAELMALCGVDIVVLDNEHYTFSEEDISSILRALSSYDTACMLRTACFEPTYLSRLMELGINGIMAQQVKTVAQAKELVRSVKYWPEGNRGIGMSRAVSFGCPQGQDRQTYMKEANDNVILMAVVEDEQGAKNAGEIARIDGIDSVNVGAMDLSLSMGFGSQMTPEVAVVINAAKKDILESGSITADFVTSPEQIPELVKNGSKLMLLGTEHAILINQLCPITQALCEALKNQ